MSLLPFLLVNVIGAVAVVLARPFERIATPLSAVVLLGAVVTALLIRPDEVVAIGGSGIATTDYLRLFLVLASVVGLLLAFVGTAATDGRQLPLVTAVTATVLATSAMTLALPDARLAVLAATAGGAFGACLAIAPARSRLGATAGTRALRAAVVAGTLAVAATAWIGRDLGDLAAQPVVFGLAYLAVALAAAIRFGAIPFHAWPARLTDAAPETALPLVTALSPAAFAIVALAWADASIAPLLVDLDSARAVVLAIAIASILLASLAAFIQDDVEHIVGYAIIGDAGVVMLAVAALDPESWAPARIWILALIVTRSAFAAWAAATRSEFQSGRVDDLRGWAVRSPLLAGTFALVALASLGLPGLAAFDARSSLVSLSLDGPLALIVLLGTLTPAAYYGRLLLVGLDRAGGRAEPRTWRPTLEPLDLTDLPGWAGRSWAANRRVGAASGAIVLALLAVAVSIGGFGGPEAAAGLPPTLDGAIESFTPDGPVAPDGIDPETGLPSSPDGNPDGIEPTP